MHRSRQWIPVGTIALIALFAFIGGPHLVREYAYAAAKGQNDAARQELADLYKQDTTSKLLAQVTKVVKPAVVEIRVSKKLKVAPDDMDEMLRRFFGEQPGAPSAPRNQQREREYLQRGLGSGVIVDAKNGYVLTNYHVVAGADETQVVLTDGRAMKAQWVRSDPQTDLAIIKVAGDDFFDAPLGDSDKMQVGDMVLAFGSPEGLQQTVTMGIISAVGRTTNEPNSYQDFIQTDAAINHGNSGGPLVNMKGEVIGINSAIISRTGVNEGIGFAIPSNMAKSVMDQLITKGKVTRGFLGVTIQNVDNKLAKSFNLPDTKGALIAGVSAGGPADKAKLKKEDFIVSVDSKPVANVNELRNTVAALEPGKSYKVEFYRNGKKESTQVTLENQPTNMALAPTPEGEQQPSETSQRFGLGVGEMNEQLAQKFGYKTTPKGVIITEVKPGSSADDSGLKPGMVITTINGKEITTPDEFKKVISAKEAAEGARIEVTDPSGNSRFVFLTPESPTTNK